MKSTHKFLVASLALLITTLPLTPVALARAGRGGGFHGAVDRANIHHNDNVHHSDDMQRSNDVHHNDDKRVTTDKHITRVSYHNVDVYRKAFIGLRGYRTYSDFQISKPQV